jgi:hypothetical protein
MSKRITHRCRSIGWLLFTRLGLSPQAAFAVHDVTLRPSTCPYQNGTRASAPLARQTAQPLHEVNSFAIRQVAGQLLLGIAEYLLHHIGGIETRRQARVARQVAGNFAPERRTILIEQLGKGIRISVAQPIEECVISLIAVAHGGTPVDRELPKPKPLWTEIMGSVEDFEATYTPTKLQRPPFPTYHKPGLKEPAEGK